MAAALLTACLTLTACGSGASSAAGSSAASSSGSAEPPAVDYSLGLEDNGRYAGISALDFVTLPEGYDAIPVGEDFHTVPTADLITAESQFMAQFSADEQITDRAVAAGDVVNLDYVGYVDGEELEGGNSQGQGLDYTAGSTQLIDDFLTQIIGAMPGETMDVNVTFPAEYPNNPDLGGKDAKFVVTIHYIHGESVSPMLTDEFVQANLTSVFGYETTDDVRAALKESLLPNHQFNYVMDWLYANCTFAELPESLIENQRQLLTAELENSAASAGVTADELAVQYGAESVEAMLDSVADNLEDAIRQNLMCQAVAEAQELTIDEAAIAHYFSEEMQVTDPAPYVEFYGSGYISQMVQMDRVGQFLMAGVV